MQREEDALHAGVAAVQVMRGIFTSTSPANKLPEDILRLIQIAISRLRDRITRNDCCNVEVTIMMVVFLTHMAVRRIYKPHSYRHPPADMNSWCFVTWTRFGPTDGPSNKWSIRKAVSTSLIQAC